MPNQDRIEIEQGDRTLTGVGSFRVSLGKPGQGGWSILPVVEGAVTFDARVTSRELEMMDSAEVRVVLANGARHTLRQAVVMEQRAGPVLNSYALRLECYGEVS